VEIDKRLLMRFSAVIHSTPVLHSDCVLETRQTVPAEARAAPFLAPVKTRDSESAGSRASRSRNSSRRSTRVLTWSTSWAEFDHSPASEKELATTSTWPDSAANVPSNVPKDFKFGPNSNCRTSSGYRDPRLALTPVDSPRIRPGLCDPPFADSFRSPTIIGFVRVGPG